MNSNDRHGRGKGRPPERAARIGREPRAARQSEESPAEVAREQKIYGVNACQAFFTHRRDRIVRAYFSEAVGRRHFGALMKWLASQRLAYHLVTDDELDRICGATHHEGVCLLVRAAPARAALDWLRADTAPGARCLLALEHVANPHNLGAILRVAAHFGVPAVIVPDARAMASGATLRTAEGGAEFVEVLDAPDFAGTLTAFRAAGWRLVATSSHRGGDLYAQQLPARCLLLLGEESGGLSGDSLDQADGLLKIPGTGKVESLNVAVATGVLLGEWWRQHPAKGTRRPVRR